MAFVGLKSRYHIVPCNVEFEGNLNADQYCKLVVEIIKYIIYNRNQIPVQYDLWHRELAAQKKMASIGVCQRNSNRKNFETAENIGIWIKDLAELFRSSTCIEEILIIIGATFISPKIAYKISIPESLWGPQTQNESLLIRRCLMQVLQELLKTEEVAAVSKERGPANIYLFVKMARNTDHNSFRPKLDFQPLMRGVLVDVSFNENCKNMTMLNNSLQSFKIHDDLMDTSDDSSCLSKELNDQAQKTDCIWFQSEITVKGIKNKCFSSDF